MIDILRSDEGMSLMELVVASAIGMLVLGASYLIFETAMKGFRQVENATISGRAAAQALTRVDRPLREAGNISKAYPYDLEFLSDPDDDNTLEYIRFWIDPGKTDLMVQTAASDHTASSTPLVVARGVRNTATNVAMFTYFRGLGMPITSLQSGETTGSASKIVRIVVVTQPTTVQRGTPPSYRVQTDIFLRNRTQ